MSSISSLRSTTLPDVKATSWPTLNRSVPAFGSRLQHALDIFEPMPITLDEVASRLGSRQFEQFRIGRKIVRRRGGLEKLSTEELDHLRAFLVARSRAVEGLLPPALPVLVTACIDVERPLIPGGIGKTPVAGHRRFTRAPQSLECELPAVQRLFPRAACELRLCLGRLRKTEIPVPPGSDDRLRRESARSRRELRQQLSLQPLGRMFRVRMYVVVHFVHLFSTHWALGQGRPQQRRNTCDRPAAFPCVC